MENFIAIIFAMQHVFDSSPVCPRIAAGHKCHKDSPAYNHMCDACGRTGKEYDTDSVILRIPQ